MSLLSMSPIAQPTEFKSDTLNLPASDVIQHLVHELRQPLSALESIAYYLRLTASDSTPAGHQVDRLQQMVDNANWVVNDILHAFQIAAPMASAVDAQEIFADVLEEAWISEGLDVQRDEAELPMIFVDREQFRHLIRTVLHFIRQAGPVRRTAAVSFRESGDMLQIEFLAQTPGLSIENLYQPLASKTLLSCRNIAINNGGRFEACKDDGGWLKVHVEVPLAETE
ncbi:MAG: HAMP domain-containing histidine kinase [Acidobacteria bacterium]|nr:HAMP domain-containing histidine kinase [Acidobacteriota bacterium]